MANLEVLWILRFIIVVDQSNWSLMINCFCLLCLFVQCANHFSICLFLSTIVNNNEISMKLKEAFYCHICKMSIFSKSKKQHFF